MRCECDRVIVERELVDETEFNGKVGKTMAVDQMLIRASIASIKIDMPFYIETLLWLYA